MIIEYLIRIFIDLPLRALKSAYLNAILGFALLGLSLPLQASLSSSFVGKCGLTRDTLYSQVEAFIVQMDVDVAETSTKLQLKGAFLDLPLSCATSNSSTTDGSFIFFSNGLTQLHSLKLKRWTLHGWLPEARLSFQQSNVTIDYFGLTSLWCISTNSKPPLLTNQENPTELFLKFLFSVSLKTVGKSTCFYNWLQTTQIFSSVFDISPKMQTILLRFKFPSPSRFVDVTSAAPTED